MDARWCGSMHALMGQMSDVPMMGGGMGLWMLVSGLSVLGLIVVVVVVVVRAAAGGRHRGSDAVRELDVRYARGDVDREEYLRRRDDLERR